MTARRGFVIILLSVIALLSCTAVGQPPQMPFVGDLFEDNIIDYKDLEILADYWLDVNCTSPNCPADLDGVAGVNMGDYAVLAPNWKKSRVVINEFLADNCPHLAAAISYYLLLSLFPLVLAAISIFGFISMGTKSAFNR